jgi:hypothetical protein
MYSVKGKGKGILYNIQDLKDVCDIKDLWDVYGINDMLNIQGM